MPIRLDRSGVARELGELNAKLTRSAGEIARLQPVPVGTSRRELVAERDGVSLYHYPAESGGPRNRTPLLIVYSLVNRPYILDLKPERSLIGALRDLGSEVYLLDWGYPDPADRYVTLDDYVNFHLDRCLSLVSERHGGIAVNMLGVCQGGTLSVCYAAIHPERVNSLITLVAPIDFHAGASSLYHLAKHVDFDRLVDSRGNIPAELLNTVFVSLKPYRLLSQRYVDMLELAGDEQAMADFLRMEKWMYDSPNQAGEAFRQFAKDFYQANGLVKGTVVLGTERVDLSRITMPVCNVYATYDHLVPPPSALALGEHIGSSDYRALDFPGGHLGVFISGRAQKALFPELAAWLRERD